VAKVRGMQESTRKMIEGDEEEERDNVDEAF
jgi:hypothetical protein